MKPIFAVAVALVAAIGVAATLLFVRVPTPVAGAPLAGATSSSAKDPLAPKASGTPQVPGWQVIEINNGAALDTDKAYDVPPAWRPFGGGLVMFGDHNEVSLVAPSVYKQGYCTGEPKSWRAMAGLMVAQNKGSLENTAAATAQLIANTVFTTKDRVQPETFLGDPRPVTMKDNKKGVLVVAKLTIPVTTKDTCGSAKVSIAVLVFEMKNPTDDNATLIAMADQAVPDAVSEEDLQKIVTSFHTATS
ncbi:hypothetical protein [Actinocrispum sp. NPDC049592]|uniref:hypothetical protein n=1 Tax=Actinocrispum sp. NPDC049592 TaxID=3154835 RepID=UPI003415812A